MTYAIRFDFPEGTVYAGLHDGALGFAPTLRTALLFDDADKARDNLVNGYGMATRLWGRVVIVDTVASR